MDVDFGIRVFTIGDLVITETIRNTWIVSLILIGFALLVRAHLARVPGRLQLIAELIIDGVHWLVDSTMGEGKRGFAPYVLTLTLFLILANLSGLLLLRQPTADLNTTFTLAAITFVLIHYHSLKAKGGLGYIKEYFQPLPFLFPLNLISELALPLSLSFRLFGNMLGGVIILGLLYFYAPVIVPIIGHLYFDMFAGLIQTFIFVMLTITFITLKMN